jgi:hypothetical protein
MATSNFTVGMAHIYDNGKSNGKHNLPLAYRLGAIYSKVVNRVRVINNSSTCMDENGSKISDAYE